MFSRRDFAKMAVAAVPAAEALAKSSSTTGGVRLGVQTYSFRDRSMDGAIAGLKETGVKLVELWQGHIEPQQGKGSSPADLRKWRTTVSLDVFKEARRKFDAAGIEIYAYNYSFREDFTDAEIARGFEFAKALGVKYLTASANVSTAKRIDPFAKKAKVKVGMHNHSNIKENEFAKPEDFTAAMSGMSEYIAINLDIGHFWAAGFDPVFFLKENYKRIVTLHIKDRKKNQGPNMPFGEGDTPIKEVLQTLKTLKLKIPANIEYEYKGADTLVEVKKCFEYCKKALA
jgi:sugar phosphate isomerase/epimerase